MNQSKLRGAFLTLRGHIVMLGVPFAVTMSVIELLQLHDADWLTLGTVLRTVVGCFVAGAAFAALVWFAATRPLLRKSRK